jgi:hypothetical protein
MKNYVSLQRNCLWCGGAFVVKATNKNQEFCSRRCAQRSVHSRPDYRKKMSKAMKEAYLKRVSEVKRLSLSRNPLLKYAISFHIEIPKGNGEYIIHKDK